jgi:hypothetical protein
MNTYGKVTAAFGSVVLNVALALVLSQGAAAATPPAEKLAASPAMHTHVLTTHHQASENRCTARLRTRTIVAVILGIIV